jgi:hypothetical protein
MSDLQPYTLALACTAASIADRAVVCDIESEAVHELEAGQRWYDIRPMLNEREHSPEFIDMNSEALAWAFARGLIEQHATRKHLVRIARWPAPAPHAPHRD